MRLNADSHDLLKQFDFEWLLWPLAIEDFEAKYWQERYSLVATDRPGYFDDLFSYGDIEAILEYGQPRPPSIRLVSSRADNRTEVPIGRNGRLDADRLRRYFSDGHTIVVNNVQDFSPAVARLIQSMQRRTSYRVEANTYLTPPSAQGFNSHYDTHDVLVAQIDGSKRWRVYGEDSACPLQQMTNGDPVRRENLPTPEQFILHPGDLLYIPRGWIHEAETDESNASLHLTLGVHAPTGRDLLMASIEVLCRIYPEFRQTLPLGFLHNSREETELAQMVQQLTNLLKTNPPIAQAIDHIEDDLIRRGRTAGDGRFVASVEALESIGLETRLDLRRHIHTRLMESPEGVGLQFSQSLLEAPDTYREALEFVTRTAGDFGIDELPGLRDDQKVSLGRSLVRDGLAVLATGERDESESDEVND